MNCVLWNLADLTGLGKAVRSGTIWDKGFKTKTCLDLCYIFSTGPLLYILYIVICDGILSLSCTERCPGTTESLVLLPTYIHTYRQTYIHTHRQTDRDRQTETDRQTKISWSDWERESTDYYFWRSACDTQEPWCGLNWPNYYLTELSVAAR